MIGAPSERTAKPDRFGERLVEYALPLEARGRLAHQANAAVQHRLVEEFGDSGGIADFECPRACESNGMVNDRTARIDRM